MAAIHSRASAHMLATTSRSLTASQPRRCCCVRHGLSTSRHVASVPRSVQQQWPSQRQGVRREFSSGV